MSSPVKRTGFFQGIYEASTTKKERLGAKRELWDGRVFHYAKAGADLVAGKMCVASPPASGWLYKACPAVALGSKSFTVTVAAGGTLSEGQLEGGLFIVTKGATVDSAPDGYSYPIAWNSALGATDTSLTLVLEEPLVKALTTSDYFRIQPNLWASVDQSSGASSAAIAGVVPVGVPLINVDSGSYFWILTKGQGPGRIKSRKAMATMTLSPGQGLALSVSPGYLFPYNDSSITMYPHNPIIARFAGLANTASAYTRHAFPVIYDMER